MNGALGTPPALPLPDLGLVCLRPASRSPCSAGSRGSRSPVGRTGPRRAHPSRRRPPTRAPPPAPNSAPSGPKGTPPGREPAFGATSATRRRPPSCPRSVGWPLHRRVGGSSPHGASDRARRACPGGGPASRPVWPDGRAPVGASRRSCAAFQSCDVSKRRARRATHVARHRGGLFGQSSFSAFWAPGVARQRAGTAPD